MGDAGDCDDADPAVHPGAVEVCNTIDDDCDALTDDADPGVDLTGAPTWCPDVDADGWTVSAGAAAACAAPDGFLACSDPTDCDDTRAAVSPDATEVCGNGLDDDCDGAPGVCPLDASTPADADATYVGAQGDGAGYAVVMLDVDGNGDLDLLVGAPYPEAGPVKTGAVALHTVNPAGRVSVSDALGLARGGTDADWDESNFGAQLAAADEFGTALATDDFDGDGAADLVVLASDGDATYLFLGPLTDGTAADLAADTRSGPADRVATPGDGDGDGLADLLLARDNQSDAELCFGGTRLLSGASLDLGVAMTAGAGGDLDGDGDVDLVLSDYMDDDYQGIVRLAYGPITGPPSFATIDATDQDFFGFSLAIGDLDGDGAADLAVGAPWDGSAGAYAGAVFVFDGVRF